MSCWYIAGGAFKGGRGERGLRACYWQVVVAVAVVDAVAAAAAAAVVLFALVLPVS